MGGLGMWLRAEARRRWRAWLAVALIAGVGWGAVLTAVAGARRTQSAFTRFRAHFGAHDVLLSGDGPVLKGLSADVERLPEVVAAGPFQALNVEVIDPPPPANFLLGAAFVPTDERFARAIDRPKILSGRLPNPASASEAFVNPAFSRGLRIGVGDTVTLRAFAEDNDPSTPPVYEPPLTLRIVGIGVTQSEVYPITFWDRISPGLFMTPAAYGAYRGSAFAFDGVILRLRPGTDMASFQRRAAEIKSQHPEAGDPQAPPFLASETSRARIVRAALRPQVIALAASAIALGVTLLLVMTQTVASQIVTDAADYPALRSLGVSPRQLSIAALVPVAAAGVLAAAIAIGVAIAASPLAPIGAARLSEPEPGVAVDGVVLGIGALVLLAFLVLAAVLPARRAAKTFAAGGIDLERPSRVAERFARLPAPASIGLRMALEPGRGSTAVPVRTVIAGAIVSMTALAAAYTFGASLNRAVATPRIFGQRWDAIIDGQFGFVRPEWFGLTTDPSYAAVAGGFYPFGPLSIAGTTVPVIGIDQLKGSVFPTLLQGRPPKAADEIVLGTSTLRRISASVGDVVRIDRDEGTQPVKVVGRAVFPALGLGALFPTGLGEGAVVTVDGLGGPPTPPGTYSFVLVRFAPDATEDAVRRVDEACKKPELAVNLCAVQHLQKPPEIVSYGQVRNLPWILATVLGVLAAATLGHALLATVRRRRRDLAVLKTLGFVRIQISAAVAWQASALILFAVVGIPLGVAAGRWAWVALADQLGIPAEPRVPLLIVGLTIPAAILLGNIVSALPGRAASRTQAALVLRTE